MGGDPGRQPAPGLKRPWSGRYTSVPIVLMAGIAVCVTLLAHWRAEFTAHRRRVETLQWRIHVNGIHGESTVTRIIAGMLREAGYVTIAKSTGTFAAVINRDGVDEPIDRRGRHDPRADRGHPHLRARPMSMRS